MDQILQALRKQAPTEFDFQKKDRLRELSDAIQERRRGMADRAKGVPGAQRDLTHFDQTILSPLMARANALRDARVVGDLVAPGIPISLAIDHLETWGSLVETAGSELDRIESMLPSNAAAAVLTSAARPAQTQRIYAVAGGHLVVRKIKG